ncbi:hypothetical protein LTR66_010777 [Elasticomyces elasticus]|nr:hypothetical protein LTR66_010777 [Elasticomyces elasticus]KAK4988260.1 hypothetical protein LTR50_004086 [Elasticomyces elasticus]
MPYFTTSQEWQHHSSLLLQARPTTVGQLPPLPIPTPPPPNPDTKLTQTPPQTRITTKYTITNPSSPSFQKRKAKRATPAPAPPAPSTEPPESNGVEKHSAAPRATLTLKTFDPVSGVCLKYRTDKAAEVGRLIGGLGRLGRHMAALPEVLEDTAMADAPAAEGTGTSTPVPAARDALPATAESKAQSAGGGGKKKKKGKK